MHLKAVAVAVATLSTMTAASGDVMSLLQRHLGTEKETVRDAYHPLITVKQELDDPASVKGLLQQFVTLERDISVALEVNGPRVYTQARQADLSTCEKIRGLLDSHLQQLLASPSAPAPAFGPRPASRVSRPAELSMISLQQFNSSVRRRLFPPKGQLAFLLSSDKALCIQGPTHYMKRVLSSLRTTPLQYGFSAQKSFLDIGECKSRGYRSRDSSGRVTSCYPEASVWMKSSMRAARDFDKEMMETWKEQEHKGPLKAETAMAQACKNF